MVTLTTAAQFQQIQVKQGRELEVLWSYSTIWKFLSKLLLLLLFLYLRLTKKIQIDKI